VVSCGSTFEGGRGFVRLRTFEGAVVVVRFELLRRRGFCLQTFRAAWFSGGLELGRRGFGCAFNFWGRRGFRGFELFRAAWFMRLRKLLRRRGFVRLRKRFEGARGFRAAFEILGRVVSPSNFEGVAWFRAPRTLRRLVLAFELLRRVVSCAFELLRADVVIRAPSNFWEAPRFRLRTFEGGVFRAPSNFEGGVVSCAIEA